MTDAIGAAVEERLVRMKPSSAPSAQPTVEEILELVHSFHLRPINEGLTGDEILGYDPEGLWK